MIEEKFTNHRKCPHCQNNAPMGIIFSQNDVKTHHEHDDYPDYSIDCGYIYSLLRCPACEGITFERFYFHEDFGPSDSETEILFPAKRNTPLGLPNEIARAHEAAMRVRAIDTNAYGVLMRRLLEMVCQDRDAKGKDLNDQLGDLAKKGEIPEKLHGVAHGLREFGNVGAHATAGDLTPDAIPILDDLARAVLEYVYSAPQLVERATEKIEGLKKKEMKKKTKKKKNKS